MMTPRLVELHRTLKPTGTLYLHCDPTASHYLKPLLDAIFGVDNFRNEIVWRRTNARSSQAKWPWLHDTILMYSRTNAKGRVFRLLLVAAEEAKMPHTLITGPDGSKYQTYELTGAGTRNGETGQPWRGFDPNRMGRHWANLHAYMDALDEAGLIHWPQKGGFPRRRAAEPFDPSSRKVAVGDVWTDIDRINQSAHERLGYPTQKPEELLERIIATSSNEGDVVLDPFCGCGTTVAVAQRLRRRWIGIDITYLAVDLITKRLIDTYGPDVADSFEVRGIPRDLQGAQALFNQNPFDFERWAVSLVGGQPNEKQVGDRGVDGVIRFPLDDRKQVGRVLVSVKGGSRLGPTMIRDLIGTVDSHRAQMGVLITMENPTRGMIEAVQRSGLFVWSLIGRSYPRVQIITVPQLLAGRQPEMPQAFLPYVKARRAPVGDQGTLDL